LGLFRPRSNQAQVAKTSNGFSDHAFVQRDRFVDSWRIVDAVDEPQGAFTEDRWRLAEFALYGIDILAPTSPPRGGRVQRCRVWND
jgi:hypothetical protein